MSSDPRHITKYVTLRGNPLSETEIDPKTNDLLNNIGLDVYKKLEDFNCIHHPNSRKRIIVSKDDEDIAISIYTCCYDFATRIDLLFEDYSYPVTAVFLRPLDQREQN